MGQMQLGVLDVLDWIDQRMIYIVNIVFLLVCVFEIKGYEEFIEVQSVVLIDEVAGWDMLVFVQMGLGKMVVFGFVMVL